VFNYNDMASRNRGRPLLKPLVIMIKTLGFHLRSPIIRVIILYSRKINHLVRTQGFPGTVKYLKAAHTQLMQALAGYKPKIDPSTGTHVAKTGYGLPRIIPLIHRRRIQAGDKNIIRLWLSFLSLYRVLKYPGKLKLETITGDTSFSSLRIGQQKGLINSLTG